MDPTRVNEFGFSAVVDDSEPLPIGEQRGAGGGMPSCFFCSKVVGPCDLVWIIGASRRMMHTTPLIPLV